MDITGKEVQYAFNHEMRPGYLVLPAGAGPFPGVVVIHEAFGLNDNIRQIAGRFAQEGYAALAVDMFSGRNKVVCLFRFMSANLRGLPDHEGISELEAALTFFGEQEGVDASRMGAIGFCMGGGFAITWAFNDARLQVIAPFYGSAPKNLSEAAARSCPVVGSYPEQDFTTAPAKALQAALDLHYIPNDIKFYPGARHSFFNDQNPRTYHPQAAADAWQRTLAYFQKYLRV